MKKILGIIVVLVAIVVVGMGISNNISPQPAQVTKIDTAKTADVQPQEKPASMEDLKTEYNENTNTERKKREGFFCVANNNGTVTYGSASWVGWWIFGHWDYGVGITMSGTQGTCDAFLEGVTTVLAP